MSAETSDRSSAPFDPKRRKLCPDGACVGLLDDNGRCGECRRTFSQGAVVTPAAHLDSGPSEAQATDGPDGFDPRRPLCPDGACIGVIGADNLCTVCRRPTGAPGES